MASPSDGSGIDALDTASAVLAGLKETEGAGVSELAAELDLAKSTVHRHLTSLADHGWVVKRGDRYRIGFRFLEFGEHTRTRTQGYRMAGRTVEELAAETEERAQFLVEERARGVYLYREWGRRAVRTDPGIGRRAPLHATSAGKAILAWLPEERVAEILDRRGLDRLTERTITDRDALFDELERVRERGYAVNDREKLEGVRAVGVPVRDAGGRVFGGLSVSAPAHRLKDDRLESEIPDLLRGLANELELNLAHG